MESELEREMGPSGMENGDAGGAGAGGKVGSRPTSQAKPSVPPAADGQSEAAAEQQSFWADQGGGAGPPAISETRGSPLPEGVRSSMERHLGTDFSDVKVHTGSDAAGTASQLGARAFTLGSNIHFGAGHFDPGSESGKQVLAHELTHVAQAKGQGASARPHALPGPSGSSPEVSQPGDAAEVEADAVASSFGKPGANPPRLSAKLEGAGQKLHLSRTGTGDRGADPVKTPAATTKGSAFGPKVADAIPTDGVPPNWSREKIEDAIANYTASIASRKAELAAFDQAGIGSATQRLAHARRITQEEAFLRSLKKALGSAR